MASDVPTPEIIISAIKDIALARYLSGGAATLALYDWGLLFSEEMDTIWKAKWTVPKFLYYYIRFITAPFICLMAFQLSDLRGPLSRNFCEAWVIMATIPMFSSHVASNWIFTLRLVALFRRRTYFVWFMVTFFVATYIVTLTMIILALIQYHKTIDYYSIVGLCGAIHAAPTFPAIFYAPAAYELFLFVMTAYKAYQDAAIFSNGTTAPFLIVLYRDGLICFVIMFAIRSWNIWIYTTQPITSLNIGANVMWAVNTVMSTRVYLNLVFLARKPNLTTFCDTQGLSGTGVGMQFRRGMSVVTDGTAVDKQIDTYLDAHRMEPLSPRLARPSNLQSDSSTPDPGAGSRR